MGVGSLNQAWQHQSFSDLLLTKVYIQVVLVPMTLGKTRDGGIDVAGNILVSPSSIGIELQLPLLDCLHP